MGQDSKVEQETTRPLVAFLQRLAMMVASGYILMFFSEYYFLNEGPGADFAESWCTSTFDTFFGLGVFSLYYAGWGAIMLCCIGIFRVRSFWSLFVAGALFGWAVEGIIIPLIYSEMPYSLGWPSLGWHVLVDVMLGWYLVRWILQKNKYAYTIALAVALGLYWGVQCTWYWGPYFEAMAEKQVQTGTVVAEEAPDVAPVEDSKPEATLEADDEEELLPPLPGDVFPAYALVLGTLLILGYIVLDKAGGNVFRPTIIEMFILAAWHLWCFCTGALQMAPVAIYVLPALFVGAFLILWWNRRVETRPDILSTVANPVGWGQYALLLLMPVCAIPVYLVFFKYQIQPPVLGVVLPPLQWIGIALLLVSVLMIAIRRPVKNAMS